MGKLGQEQTKLKKIPTIKELPADQPWLSEREQRPDLNGSKVGQMLFRHRPEDYRKVVHALAAGRGIRAICNEFKISSDVIIAIRKREGITVNSLKGLLSDKMALASQMAVEGVIEAIEDGTMMPKSLPFATAILTDKALLLGGEATQRIEVAKGPDVADFAKLVEALPVDVEAEAVEPAPALGSQAVEGPDGAGGGSPKSTVKRTGDT